MRTGKVLKLPKERNFLTVGASLWVDGPTGPNYF